MGLQAARHLTLTTGEYRQGLTLGDVEEFVAKALSMGIPVDAVLSNPAQDPLRRHPIEFSLHWTEAL